MGVRARDFAATFAALGAGAMGIACAGANVLVPPSVVDRWGDVEIADGAEVYFHVKGSSVHARDLPTGAELWCNASAYAAGWTPATADKSGELACRTGATDGSWITVGVRAGTRASTVAKKDALVCLDACDGARDGRFVTARFVATADGPKQTPAPRAPAAGVAEVEPKPTSPTSNPQSREVVEIRLAATAQPTFDLLMGQLDGAVGIKQWAHSSLLLGGDLAYGGFGGWTACSAAVDASACTTGMDGTAVRLDTLGHAGALLEFRQYFALQHDDVAVPYLWTAGLAGLDLATAHDAHLANDVQLFGVDASLELGGAVRYERVSYGVFGAVDKRHLSTERLGSQAFDLQDDTGLRGSIGVWTWTIAIQPITAFRTGIGTAVSRKAEPTAPKGSAGAAGQ